jgi:ADP-ribose pyrophosphatase
MPKKRGPWTTLSSKKVYQNPWMTVKEDKVTRPDGKEGIYGTIEIKPGVSIIALDDRENVYLTKEYHYALEKDTLETVSGGIDDNETPLLAAKRELKEEAGIVAKKWTYLGYTQPLTSYINTFNHLFLARKLSFSGNNLEGTEKIEIVKMPFKKAIRAIMGNKITHAGSVAAIFKAKEYLDNN